MAKHSHSETCDVASLFARPSPYRAFVFWMTATTCGTTTLLGQVAAAAPLEAALPAPNIAPVNLQFFGAKRPAGGDAQVGQSAPGVYIQPSGSISPGVYIISAGGEGGTGTGGTDTGPGGQGGASNQVTFTLSAGAGVNSTNSSSATNPNAAVWFRSYGGNGGSPGKMSSNSGYPGQPGASGTSYSTLFDQYAAVISMTGWNDSQPSTTAVLMQAVLTHNQLIRWIGPRASP